LKYDVAIGVEYNGAVIDIDIAFRTSCMGEVQAEDLSKTLSRAIAAITAGPRSSVHSLELITDEEKQQLWSWNADVLAAVKRCVHDLFAEQAAAQPEAPAICAWDGELTYGELDTLSTRLAGHLLSLGVKPDDVVPLCFEKSMWTVVAMLAVLKAGGAFLLLDPSSPIDRLRKVCGKVSSTLVLASHDCLPVVESVSNSFVVVSRDATSHLPRCMSLSSSVQPTNAAYVIFTSGSTGEPKGCLIEHRSYCSAALGHGQALGLQTNTRSLQYGSHSFAGAIAEMMMTLIHGGCVCVPSEDDRRNNLAQAIGELKANWAFLTSTVLSSLVPDSVPSLTHICVGGEPIRPSQIAEWMDRVELRQSYGSAETSAMVSSSRLGQHSTPRDVGKAATGRYWIVDPTDANQLAPLGATGELVVEGAVIGRCYVGDARKTAAAFIQKPL
jgi:amino acid adenylation domain-containing protein